MTPYITNSDADLYFEEERYNVALWDTISEPNKTKLLNEATNLIDNLNFAGDKADEDQELEFPRGEDTEVPKEIKDACCEIAYAILSGRDIEYDAQLLGQNTASTQVGRLVLDPSVVDLAKVHNIPSIRAWNKLRPFLRNGSAITLSRIS